MSLAHVEALSGSPREQLFEVVPSIGFKARA